MLINYKKKCFFNNEVSCSDLNPSKKVWEDLYSNWFLNENRTFSLSSLYCINVRIIFSELYLHNSRTYVFWIYLKKIVFM